MNKRMILATAEWCMPCKVVKKEIEKHNYNVDIKDYDEDMEFFTENNIKSVPKLLVYDGETLITSISGIEDIMSVLKES
jgi:hypothetical protein